MSSGSSPSQNARRFKQAVRSVNLKEPDKAIRVLEPLVEQYPDSALGLLYLGLAKEQDGSDSEADTNYTRALDLPKAEAEFRAWSKNKPDIAHQLVAVGNS